MSRYFFLALYALALFSCYRKPVPPDAIDLNSGWEFSQVKKEAWSPAEVPGTVHLDLLRLEAIPEPYLDRNLDSLSWIAETDWVFRTTFKKPRSWNQYSRHELVFQGLDGYAELFLNGEPVGTSMNMFVPFRLNLDDWDLRDQNELQVIFSNPYQALQKLKGPGPERPNPHGGTRPSPVSFLRKAAYQFGWDWAPALPSMGIWKPVRLEQWAHARIRNFSVFQELLDQSHAELTAEIRVECTDPGAYRIMLEGPEIGQVLFRPNLREGENLLRLPLNLENPRVWWPNGMGEQNLYAIRIKMFKKMRLLDQDSTLFGLREIKLNQDLDSIGNAFAFEANGQPVFVQGVNYVPQDLLLNRVSPEQYRKLLSSLAEAGANMIRVWGGGIYEEDLFYALCDSLGLLVWQDFMFANTLYPADSVFLNQVRKEVLYQVSRLRNHPSLALWCGNNEIEVGFSHWGWQKQLGWSTGDSTTLWKEYLTVFDTLIPSMLHDLDPQRPYVRSSPMSNWGNNQGYLHGNMHDWAVWHGGEPVEHWLTQRPRFMTEFGMQSWPSQELLRQYETGDSMGLPEDLFNFRQKAANGNERLEAYVNAKYRPARSADQRIFVSRAHQAEWLGRAVRAQKVNQPHTRGSLVWQGNDAWPGASWSVLEYGGDPKPAYYELRRAWKPALTLTRQRGQVLEVDVYNGKPNTFKGDLVVQRINFYGRIETSDTTHIEVDPGSMRNMYSKWFGNLVEEGRDRWTVYRIQLFDGASLEFEEHHFLREPRGIWLQDPELEQRIEKTEKGYKLVLSSKFLARDVWLSCPNARGRFSENHFNLIPGEEKTILFIPGQPLPGVPAIQVECLNDYR